MVSILQLNHIFIDCWKRRGTDVIGDYFLTHFHTDHDTIPRTFPHPVWTSYPALLDDRVRTCRLQSDVLAHTLRSTIPFIPFQMHHTFESIGLWFPTLYVLYLGDGRMSDQLLHRFQQQLQVPHTIVYDALMENEAPYLFPSDTCSLLTTQLSVCPALQCVHHGILQYLYRCKQIRWRMHSSVNNITQHWLRRKSMYDPDSPFLLVGFPCTDEIVRVVPSLLWFVIHPEKNPSEVHLDGLRYRIFCSMHASHTEITTWKAALPACTFEPLPTRPLFRRTIPPGTSPKGVVVEERSDRRHD
jgi:hypothetical protein